MSAAETPRDDHIQDYKDLEGDLARAAKRALKNLEKGRKYDRVLVLGYTGTKVYANRNTWKNMQKVYSLCFAKSTGMKSRLCNWRKECLQETEQFIDQYW